MLLVRAGSRPARQVGYCSIVIDNDILERTLAESAAVAGGDALPAHGSAAAFFLGRDDRDEVEGGSADSSALRRAMSESDVGALDERPAV